MIDRRRRDPLTKRLGDALYSLGEKLGGTLIFNPIMNSLSKAYSLPIYTSGLRTTPRRHSAQLIALTTIALTVGFALLAASTIAPIPPLAALILTSVPTLAVAFHALRPQIGVASRKSGCERELPFAATFLTMAAAASISLPSAILTLSRMRFLKSFRREAERIEKVRRLYALSPQDAIIFEAKNHPSEPVRGLLLAAVSAQRSGESLFLTMKDESVKALSILLSRLKVLSDKFSLIASSQMIVFVIVPMAMIAISTMFSGIIGIQTLFMICIALPVIFTPLMVFLIDSFYPKELSEPVSLKTFALSLTFAPAAVVLYFFFYSAPTPPALPFHLSLALLCLGTTLPAGALYSISRRRTREILFALPSFTRSVAEEVKKGLSPTQAVFLISKSRTFNRSFDALITKISTNTRGGIKLAEAAAAVRMPWIAHVYFELLDYAEQIGADPRTMDALSDLVSNVYESIRSLGSQTQLFKVACIVNSIILPLSIAMVVEVVVKLFSEVMKASQLTNVPLPVGLSFIPPESIPIISTIAYSSVILNSYFIGLLGGKVSNGGSVTDGLLIATVCVFISTLSLFLFVDLSLISFVFPAVVQ